MWVRVCAIVASLFGRPGRVGGGGGDKILREKVCPLLGGQRRRPFDAGEETLCQLVKKRVVPPAQRIGPDHTPTDPAPVAGRAPSGAGGGPPPVLGVVVPPPRRFQPVPRHVEPDMDAAHAIVEMRIALV